MSSIQAALNAAQWEAVAYCEGPSLVIAGAGSGKTRVLTYKIAYLIEQGMPPQQILALTFTNKAAREMNGRIAEVVGHEQAHRVWSGTFHSIFSRILRREAAFINYTPDFTIYDTTDSRSMLKTIIKEMGLDDKVYKPQVVGARISEAKNALVLPSAYRADSSIAKRDRVDGIPQTGQIYAVYRQRCQASNAMDFDDLLLNTYLLFDEHPEVREKYKAHFQYILVDEYQDTNAAQHRIVRQLTDPTSRICVVGDDAQSIYAFRGARIDNILGFMEQYPKARLIKLERNYRSTQTIVNAANSLIKHNREQIPKKVYSEAEEGEPIRVFRTYSDKEEGIKVAGEIRRLYRSEHLEYSDMALLYRTNAQSRSFEEAFRAAGIPYRIYGGLSFYQRKEIKDTIAYFRLISNVGDEEAFKRIINYPARGIGATTIGKLQLAAAEHGVSLWEVTCNPLQYEVALNKGSLTKLTGFVTLIDGFRKRLKTTSGAILAADIIRESGIGADILADRSAEGLSRKENLEELLGAIQANEAEIREETGSAVVPLTEYLSQVSLLTDADQRDDGEPRVTLMTVHAAKGLEFDAVFITGMEDNLFPNANARFSPREMEEERRLFYVAITRAKRFCYLTYAKSRFRFGSVDFCEPSPFIDDIDKCYLEIDGKRFVKRSASSKGSDKTVKKRAATATKPKILTTRATDDDLQSSTAVGTTTSTAGTGSAAALNEGMSSAAVRRTGRLPELSAGDMVEHERFGIGTVVALEGSGVNAKACVDFRNVGRKNLLLKFAKLKKMGE